MEEIGQIVGKRVQQSGANKLLICSASNCGKNVAADLGCWYA